MPIRFRCAYCNQLMGIARRKAGTVVRCPNCSGQVVVPTEEEAPAPEPAPEPEPAAVGKLFEQDDLAKQLAGASAPLPPPAIPVPRPPADEPSDDDDDLVMPPPPVPSGIVLSKSMATLLTTAVILVVALAFVAGLLIGRFLLTPS